MRVSSYPLLRHPGWCMKKTSIVLLVMILAVILFLMRSRDDRVPQDKIVQLKSFLSGHIADQLTLDYTRHKVPLTVSITALTITGIRKSETEQDHRYLISGTVSYARRGQSTWRDQQGNEIRFEPGKEVTHWFRCGVLEDRYLGTFFIDDRNRLTLYADKPEL